MSLSKLTPWICSMFVPLKWGFFLVPRVEHREYMARKKTLEDEINEFLELWNGDQMTAFLRDIIPIFQLYDVDEEDDWVTHAVGKDNERNVRLIRTVYLISRLAEAHSGKLAQVRINFKDLFRKMEKQGAIDVAG